MILNKWATWFKGAIDGLIIGFIISGGLVSSNSFYGMLASPGYISCRFLTSCTGNICQGCTVIALMINLFYGFILGALVGLVIEKLMGKKKNVNVQGKVKSAKNKRRKR